MFHARHWTFQRQKDIECSVAGFRVAAYSFKTLKFLFDEIFDEPNYYFETSKSCPFIIDGGSNIGMSILFFKTLYPDSTIIGFEPAADSFNLLRQNVEANKLKDVKIYPLALGDVAGKVSLFRGNVAGSLRASTTIRRDSKKPDSVDQVRLSSFIDREVDFLKLDVEGAESAVIADLQASGRIRSIAKMAIEFHHHVEARKDCFSVFLDQIEKAGFGYHLIARMPRARIPPNRFEQQFQDILVCAYRKD
jgi:FkbM family methyltransferase